MCLSANRVPDLSPGLTRSPFLSTLAQSAGRLFCVWGVMWAVPDVSRMPRPSSSVLEFRGCSSQCQAVLAVVVLPGLCPGVCVIHERVRVHCYRKETASMLSWRVGSNHGQDLLHPGPSSSLMSPRVCPSTDPTLLHPPDSSHILRTAWLSPCPHPRTLPSPSHHHRHHSISSHLRCRRTCGCPRCSSAGAAPTP